VSFETPYTEDQIDSLVRSYLDDESRRVDVARNLAAITERLAVQAELPPLELAPLAPPRRRLMRLALAACLAVAVGVAGYLAITPDSANAYALVSAAESALSKQVDRCYRVESQLPKAWRANPFLSAGDETLVWTRGDRFRVTTNRGGREQVWGQDEQRRLWVVCNPKHGVQFEHDEVPPMFARTRAYLGLDARRLVRRFLEHFELNMEKQGPAGQPGVVIVRATPKAGGQEQPFNSALLEIEQKTKVIRKMELVRTIDDAINGQFTFTLIDEVPPADLSYRLEDNLAKGAEIFGQDRAADRSRLLQQLTKKMRRN
jgi:hypothetical protein